MMDYISLRQLWACRTKFIPVCLLAAGLPACALQDVKEMQQPPGQASAEAARLEETIGQQKSSIMQLELQLLSKQSEIHRISSAHEQAIQEIVRLKSKLRSRNSKAETVASLAEVKLALQSARKKDSSDRHVKDLERAQQYIAMSEAALQEKNYDGASYLIGQAKYSLRASMAAPDLRSDGNSNAHSFSLPVRMTVTKKSNVRTGPGIAAKVLGRLNSGTSVLATGYRELWVRIQMNDKSSGWIHYSLLEVNL